MKYLIFAVIGAILTVQSAVAADKKRPSLSILLLKMPTKKRFMIRLKRFVTANW